MMKFRLENDQSEPVITAFKNINDEYHEREWVKLPEIAVIYCFGYGMEALKQNYETEVLCSKLPRFLSGTEVLIIKQYPHICFVHGGAGAPMMADTVETLITLGVKKMYLFGLCGSFVDTTKIGDMIVVEEGKIEEGTSFHYVKETDFVSPIHHECQKSYELLKQDHRVRLSKIVSCDAIYRQTFNKEAYWRSLGLVGVDMETTTFYTVNNYYNIPCIAIMMVSDLHPLNQNKDWQFGDNDFKNKRINFCKTSVQLVVALNSYKAK